MPEVKVDGEKVDATVEEKITKEPKKEAGIVKGIAKGALIVGGVVLGGIMLVAGAAKCAITLVNAFEQRPEMPSEDSSAVEDEGSAD